MRKRRATKRDILADPIYNSKVIAKLINIVMIDGKKEAVFANISDLNLKNDTIDERMQSDFAISFSYRTIKAYRFDSKETIIYSDLGVK